jgi:WD40 repeat protein
VASGSSAGSIYVWDLSVDPPSKRQLSKHANWICSLVFVNDCSRMTSCSIDGKVCIWDTQTWDCIRQPWDRHLYGVNFVTLSSDGSRMAICFVDGSLKFEDIEYGSDAPLSASSRSVSIAISPDRHLGVAYSNDRSPLFSGFGDHISVNDTDAARKPISFVAFSPIPHPRSSFYWMYGRIYSSLLAACQSTHFTSHLYRRRTSRTRGFCRRWRTSCILYERWLHSHTGLNE